MANLPQSSEHLQNFIKANKKMFEKLRKFLKWSSESDSVLELGIGNGTITEEIILPLIPDDFKEYIGCDKFEFPLKLAMEKVSHEKFKTYQLDAGGKHIPEEFKNRFNQVFTNNLFHHIQDTRQILTNIMEMLKPGGQLFFNAFQKVYTDEAFDKLDEGKWRKYENRKAVSPFYRCEDSVKEYKNVINSVGFVDHHIYTDSNVSRIDEDFFKELTTFVNYRLPFVEEADKEEYLRDYIEKVANSKSVKVIRNEKTGENLYEISFNSIYGVISKPV